jgi:DNA-binding SARP family transcriptional activator
MPAVRPRRRSPRPVRASGSARHPQRRARHADELDLRCFGELRLVLGGELVDLAGVRPRARSVLRLLALHAGRLVHREQLADTLWAGLERTAALHNLQVNLSSLRPLVRRREAPPGADSLIVRQGDAYRLLVPEGSTCDLLVFEDAIAQARSGGADDRGGARATIALRRALEVYRGDLLPEEGPAEWVVGPRDRYRSQAAEAASTLASVELARGDVTAAVRVAARGVEIDPYRDAAWRTLIEAHERSGDLAASRRAQRRYADVLLDLGVDVDDAARRESFVPAGAHRG